MPEIKIAAVKRTEFGKGAARRTRRAGLVPAVLYGHGTDPIHIALPAHDTQLAMRAANALLSITVGGGQPTLALPKQVQRDPIKGSIEHLDLVIVKKGERVTVEVQLVILNEDKIEGLVVSDQLTIALEVEATNIPANVEIDVKDLSIGAQVYAKDLVLPAGAVFPGEPDDLMLSIAAAPAQEAAAAAETEEAAAE